jgi:hypothetical protein
MSPTPVRWVVFEAEALTQVDATGVAALKQTIADMGAEDMTFV